MYYGYVIKSISFPDQTYMGCTTDLKKRLSNHNSGITPHTAKYMPWKLITYIAFALQDKAYEFESFLKSGSGFPVRNLKYMRKFAEVYSDLNWAAAAAQIS